MTDLSPGLSRVRLLIFTLSQFQTMAAAEERKGKKWAGKGEPGGRKPAWSGSQPDRLRPFFIY